VIYGWFLATISDALEVVPGAEFRQAYLCAAQEHGRRLAAEAAEEDLDAVALHGPPGDLGEMLLEQAVEALLRQVRQRE
jgi:hypothetical protein